MRRCWRRLCSCSQVTTAKKDNLILNVDGAIGVAFVDLMRTCGGFSRDEADVRAWAWAGRGRAEWQ